MILLRGATVTVASLDRSIELYTRYLDYRLIEAGTIAPELAESWQAPAVAGHAYAVLQPASERDIFLRFVEQEPMPGFRALRTYGWNAIELCVSDVKQVYARLQDSPFEIIGPPRENPGLANIHPMQVKGPDEEVVFLTQINADTPPYKLPRAESLIDQVFIMVIGCRDMAAATTWFERHIRLARGEAMEIAYTMLAKAYGKDLSTQYQLTTMTHDFDVFLEVDQYPEQATARPKHDGLLPPGCACWMRSNSGCQNVVMAH
ncbi:MAG: hypothetical protein AAFY82_08960, partial [Pseudomonadota bacterium]